ncbi:hypothetical protein BDK51DRAFT_45089 [Blyttiomyces helicus]|uniref:Arrestin-like N-terminal domain-containing protein n=1 Tax=Blyttiomyces helicus TaxID=388810 RepID=A0A4P9WGT0_9FUNG|nr:hypothetical protein BDK51DRAFT_45089 [Blyttiomyces helicus]|eukprot:RKO92021.1 hypothetical protein BDK51DRAFT_45089 [Blyttiomyces helicus]
MAYLNAEPHLPLPEGISPPAYSPEDPDLPDYLAVDSPTECSSEGLPATLRCFRVLLDTPELHLQGVSVPSPEHSTPPLTGRIRVALAPGVPADWLRTVTLRLTGVERVDRAGWWGNTTTSRRVVFDTKVDLWNAGQDSLHDGEVELGFRVAVPFDCPASFEGSLGHIKYFVHAIVQGPDSAPAGAPIPPQTFQTTTPFKILRAPTKSELLGPAGTLRGSVADVLAFQVENGRLVQIERGCTADCPIRVEEAPLMELMPGPGVGIESLTYELVEVAVFRYVVESDGASGKRYRKSTKH